MGFNVDYLSLACISVRLTIKVKSLSGVVKVNFISSAFIFSVDQCFVGILY